MHARVAHPPFHQSPEKTPAATQSPSAQSRKIALLTRVILSSFMPIRFFHQRISKRPRSAQSHRKSLPPSGIVARRGVAQQRHALLVRILHPGVRALKRRQRTHSLQPWKKFRSGLGPLQILQQSRNVPRTLQPRLPVSPETQIRSHPPDSPSGIQPIASPVAGLMNQCTSVVRQRHILEKYPRDASAVRLALHFKSQ